jgi:hypothetical protein
MHNEVRPRQSPPEHIDRLTPFFSAWRRQVDRDSGSHDLDQEQDLSNASFLTCLPLSTAVHFVIHRALSSQSPSCQWMRSLHARDGSLGGGEREVQLRVGNDERLKLC